jgi:valyl-tRNA synthetase
MTNRQLPKAYDPSEVEPKWYRFWMEQDYFHADAAAPKTPFSIVIPPPNVTGSLHMGHALGFTIQDILVRWRRMQAFNALWLPGSDHAGISTQIVVEKDVQRSEGKSRHDLGREEFVRRVWAWKARHGERIVEQMKTMGYSLDWKRERFTMDEGLSRAVRECFVSLHEEGLIYRARRLINWCSRCRTALSDLEVEVADEPGSLWSIAYPVPGAGTRLVVATTRPETMLGDTAVAVHPEDERYRHLIGKQAELPLTGRHIPVIGDAVLVDKEFGTGAVKVTPGHDFNDFETGLRHDLPQLSIFDADGKVIAPAPERYRGLDVAAARKAVLADLEAQGYLVEVKPHTVPLGRCERCGTPVEPLLSMQWFVKVAPLAGPAVEAVEAGRTKFVPEAWTKTYMNWMRNLRDWCISRQLWWGHRIPAWTCGRCQKIVVAREDPTACPECGAAAADLTQDPDVLDTWFSSALWPFSTLGWPAKTRELGTFYPTSVLVTAFDIIFFWVARMMMMGLHFMKKVPFRTVYITSLVVDENGEKMSKMKGNGVDPLDVVFGATRDQLVEKTRTGGAPEAAVKNVAKQFPEGIPAAGADALRFTLAVQAAQGRNTRLSVARVENNRHFANKIWNASRFALMNLEGFDADRFDDNLREGPRGVGLALPDRWILSRLQRVIREVDGALEAYRINDAAQVLYRFFWTEVCDWYIELSKAALHDETHAGDAQAANRRRLAQGTLARVLETALRLLHPIMPFITEEIWQQLPKPAVAAGSIMIASYPAPDDRFADAEAESQMQAVIDVAVAVRNIRAEYKVRPSDIVEVRLRTPRVDGPWPELWKMVERAANARLQVVDALPDMRHAAKAVVDAATELLVPLEGLIDIDKERARLLKEAAKQDKEAEGLSRKLADASFVERAPAEVVDGVRARLAEAQARAERLRAAASALS